MTIKLIRILSFVGGAFVMFYGIGQMLGNFGFNLGCIFGGLAAIIWSFLTSKTT